MVGAGIVIGTLIFIGEGYDFRAGDAALLNAKIERCASRGFDLNSLKGAENMELLSESCGLNKEILERDYRIKICTRGTFNDASECIASADSVFVYGDLMPCEFSDSNKFLGCSRSSVGEYFVISATNQQIRRVAR